MSRKLSSVFYKLFFSYTILLIVTTLIIGTTSYLYFTTNFNREIERIHSRMLAQTNELMHISIFQKAEKIYAELIMNPAYQPAIQLFDAPLESNYSTINEVYKQLKDISLSDQDLLDYISIYYKENNMLISSKHGVSFFNDTSGRAAADKDWIVRMDQARQSTLWIETRNAIENASSYNVSESIFSYVRAFPVNVRTESAKGYIAVHMKEKAIFEMIRSKEPSDRGSNLVIDGEGHFIAAADSKLAEIVLSDSHIMASLTGDVPEQGDFIGSIDGIKSMISYTTIPANGWKLVFTTPIESFYQTSSIVQRTLIVICLVAIIIGMIISNVFTLNLYNPLRRLLNSVRQVFGPSVAAQEGHANEYAFINSTLNHASAKMLELETAVKANVPLIKHNLAISLLSGTLSTETELRERLELLHLALEGPYFCSILFSFEEEVMINLKVENKQIIIYNALRFLENLEIPNVQHLAAALSDLEVVLIISSKQESLDQSHDIHQFISLLTSYTSGQFGFFPQASVGDWVNNPLAVKKSHEQSLAFLQYSYWFPELKVFTGTLFMERELSRAEMPDALLEAFADALKTRNREAIHHSVDAFVNHIREGCYSSEHSHEKLRALITVHRKYVSDMQLHTRDIVSEQVLEHIKNVHNLDQFRNWLLEIVDIVIQFIDDLGTNKSSEVVERVRLFVRDNLNQETSLQSASELVNLHPRYLSRLFKEETGINFIDYITSMRMEKAVDLLLGTEITMEEIAERVGYNSSAYFIKKFREQYGIPPKTYRSNHNAKNL
ncbi:helix-turn-helix domain-containing protein [Paenibacillus eucommiae]|uniref:AraC-like DNA-binding protein n=1 Tax=Paenibacillus eucommiae TaxID=1355755 RepID=A0ABS4IPB1_9BACL|nr:helix-turn-helix domain-containing protein [Paenibacillus eucommiae]MBP1989403.1 AraC-like DNA-binding protein [Paenibacillus eucommiae]